MDRFFATISARAWEELKIAYELLDSRDEWVDSVRRGNKKPYEPPRFGPPAKPKRRRLNGQEL